MPVPLDQMMEGLPAERRAKIARDARAIVSEQRTLAELRRALKVTQAALAKALETTQGNVAQIEAKDDVMVSTVNRVVTALGGTLDLVVHLPGRESVSLSFGAPKGKLATKSGGQATGHSAGKKWAAPKKAAPADQAEPRRRRA